MPMPLRNGKTKEVLSSARVNLEAVLQALIGVGEDAGADCVREALGEIDISLTMIRSEADARRASAQPQSDDGLA